MSRFPDLIQASMPAGISDLLRTVSADRHITASQYVRTAVMERLKADGATLPPTDAGSLYNVVEGQSMFALMDGERVVTMGYYAEKPDDGRTWLPVVYKDSAPFDAEKHWRLPPITHVEADRVVRVCPVIVKSWEHF